MQELPLQDIAKLADQLEASADEGNAAIAWHSASRTDVGRVRHINEDAFLDSEEQRLWVVADGMGGHSRGDYASSAIIRHLREFPRQSMLLANLQDLEDRLHAANEQCRNAFRNKKPGSTVVSMLAHGHYCFFLWAGDSRVYRQRAQLVEQLTQDHSQAQQKLDRGELTAAEAADHQSAHVLTRAVGIREKLELDLAYCAAESGDRYLLCSDGLYNYTDPDDMALQLGNGSPQEACDALVKLAMAGGGRDNITVIVVDVEPAG